MAKKRHQQRWQTARDTQSNGPLPDTQNAKPKHSHPPSAKSDRLTGEPLRRETLKWRVPDVRTDWLPTPIQRADGWDAHLMPVPLAVSSAKVARYSRSGTREWTPEFSRYIGESAGAPVAGSEDEVRVRARVWWLEPAVVSQLHTLFPSDVIDAVERWQSGLADAHALATELAHSIGWLDAKRRALTREVLPLMRAVVAAEMAEAEAEAEAQDELAA